MKYDVWVRPVFSQTSFDPISGHSPETAGLREEVVYLALDILDDGSKVLVVNEEGRLRVLSSRHFIVDSVELDGRQVLPQLEVP